MRRPALPLALAMLVALALGFWSARATPTVQAASGITLSPTSGASPSNTTISGTGFGFGEQVVIKFNCGFPDCSSMQVLGSATADNGGSFSLAARTPAGFSPGTYKVGARGLTTGAFAVTTYTISSAPQVLLSPASGPGGSLASISGSGFQPGETVTIKWNCASLDCSSRYQLVPGADGRSIPAHPILGTVGAGSAGSWTETFSVPAFSSGVYSVAAIGQTSSDIATASFTVNSAPSVHLNVSGGVAGSQVTATGSGYRPGESVTAKWNCPARDCSSLVTLGTASVDSSGSWTLAFAIPRFTPGTYQVGAVGGSSASFGSTPYSVYATASDPIIAAAGDIACAPADVPATDYCQQQATADLLTSRSYSAVLALGDTQYNQGALSEFQSSYDPSWGRLLAVTHPVPGNHEYRTAAASGYFSYFGSAAGDPNKGYYSYEIGTWHIIALNSNCSNIGGCQQGSAEEQWLRADLASHSSACTLAYWHHPRFSSGGDGNNVALQPLWQALYDYHADLVLNGHTHDYERFGPQDPQGNADPYHGIREFVVGTGGEDHGTFFGTQTNTEINNSDTFGILQLTLHPTSYDWEFRPAAGGTFSDSGSAPCH